MGSRPLNTQGLRATNMLELNLHFWLLVLSITDLCVGVSCSGPASHLQSYLSLPCPSTPAPSLCTLLLITKPCGLCLHSPSLPSTFVALDLQSLRLCRINAWMSNVGHRALSASYHPLMPTLLQPGLPYGLSGSLPLMHIHITP